MAAYRIVLKLLKVNTLIKEMNLRILQKCLALARIVKIKKRNCSASITRTIITI